MGLSVIIPCHNVAEFITEAVFSLGSLDRPDIELIFVDDASTDQTGTLLERVRARHSSVSILTHSLNQGVASARNTGIDAAQGRYIAFLDADDFVAVGYFEELLRQAERLGCDFLRTDHVRVSGRKRTIERVPFGPRGTRCDPRSGILPVDRKTSVDYPYPWAGIYSRRLFERGLLHFTAGLHTCEDRAWNWRLHLRAESFAVVGLTGVFYRRGTAHSLTAITDPRQFDFIPAFDQIVEDVLTDPDADRLLPKALRSYSAMMCYHLKRLPDYQAGHADTLRTLCRTAADKLPREPFRMVIADLDPVRRAQMTDLVGRG